MSRKYELLLTPTYLVALLSLLLNDFVWKTQNPTWITGKLSDFSGLFCLAVFLSILLPNWSGAVNIGLAVLFSLWKSPFADVAIDSWNALIPYPVTRVIDYSDLSALLILPFAYLFYTRSEISVTRNRVITTFVLFLSCFAFLATSKSSYETYTNIFSFPGTKEQFVEKLNATRVRISDIRGRDHLVIQFEFPARDECFGHIGVDVQVRDLNGSAEVRLSRLFVSCSKKGGEKIRLFRQFESFGKKMGLRQVCTTSRSSRQCLRLCSRMRLHSAKTRFWQEKL